MHCYPWQELNMVNKYPQTTYLNTDQPTTLEAIIAIENTTCLPGVILKKVEQD